MFAKWTKRVLTLLVALSVAAVFVWLMWPQPILVDVETVKAGPMQLTVNEEGVIRIREVYVVSAPVAGHVERSPREIGDAVAARSTVIASIRPEDSAILDVRTRQQLLAAVEAAKAARFSGKRGHGQPSPSETVRPISRKSPLAT